MRRELSSFPDKEYDLIIIGAGAFGSCAAWEAASRGISVALVERGDFCNATSANHLRMVHGGIRYLQHLDFYRVRESCRERTALLRIAPHLVRPLPIVMPTYGHGLRGREVLQMGLMTYDLVTLDRNQGIRDPERTIPRGSILSRAECLERFPYLPEEGLTGAGLFYDGQFHNPSRLALAFLQSATSEGADIANYVEAEEFLLDAHRVRGIRARDVLAGGRFEVRGRMVLNAAGPWADRLLSNALGTGLDPKPVFSRDVGLVLSNRLNETFGLACQVQSKDQDALLSRQGRHIFIVPWQRHTLVGVWHSVHRKGPEELDVAEEEVRTYLSEINEAYPGLALQPEDVARVYSGLTLFGDADQDNTELSFGKRSFLVDHTKTHSVDGLLTLLGVRATTARGQAKGAIDLVVRKLGKGSKESRTAVTPIRGGNIENFEDYVQAAVSRGPKKVEREALRALIHNHGTDYERILELIEENEGWGATVSDSRVIRAEVIHAVRAEMAQTVEDVLLRRTDLCHGGSPHRDSVRICAELMGAEMGWDEARIRTEIESTLAGLPPH